MPASPAPPGSTRLSPNQFQVWVADRLHSSPSFYRPFILCQIFGELDPTQFQEAFQKVVDSNDTLRMVFEEADGMPFCRIQNKVQATVAFQDFSTAPQPLPKTIRFCQDKNRIPFDITRTVFESHLIRCGPSHYCWYLCCHHLVCDGWSFHLIFDQVNQAYQALSKGGSSPSPSAPAFADYLREHESHPGTDLFQQNKKFWDETLAEVVEPVPFYDTPLKPKGTQTFARIVPVSMDSLRGLASADSLPIRWEEPFSVTSLFVTVLASFLHRLSDQETISIGLPYHNRRSESQKQMVGFFSEVLPILLNVKADETVAGLFQQVQERIRAGIRHAPFSVFPASLRRLYETTVNAHLGRFGSFAGFPVKTELVVGLDQDQDFFNVQVSDLDGTGTLRLEFTFNREVFNEAKADRAIDHFQRLLHGILAKGSARIAALELLSPAEKQTLLVDWNSGKIQDLPQASYVDLFKLRVRESPQALAVAAGNQSRSYAELDAESDRLASFLTRFPLGEQPVIGLMLDRSIELAVAILATMKVGAAYLPLDPSYPRERLQFLIQDSGLKILLSQKRYQAEAEGGNHQVIWMDEPLDLSGKTQTRASVSPVTGDSPAYLIYTSGSTGQPKGVVITHRSLISHNLAIQKHLQLSPADRVLQFSSISFDISVEEIFPTWLFGASLIFRSEGIHTSIPEFFDFVRQQRITILDVPTAFWHEMVLAMESAALPDSVRLVVIGGEKASDERFAEWCRLTTAKTLLFNTYGPTETTVSATLYHAPRLAPSQNPQGAFCLGRPLDNTLAFVVDSRLNPVPPGVPGELLIGGPSVAQGYLRRNELTSERFISNPFLSVAPASAGPRLYRTGDRVRYRDDGNIEFLGRSDSQIKIRGFRIEPGEIEAVIKQHPGVQDVLVIPSADSNGNKRLLAYFVPAPNASIAVESLREELKSKLPDYMVPSAFAKLDRLPLTPSGKLDRKSLPAITAFADDRSEEYVAPRTPSEQLLARIWQQVLGSERVGVHDHFFEMGGHSLQAIQVFTRIERETKRKLPLATLFQAPTIAQLAAILEQDHSTPSFSHLVPIRAAGKRNPFFLVHGHGGEVLFYQELVHHLSAEFPVFGLQARPVVSPATPTPSVGEMALTYIRELKTAQPQGPYLLGGYCSGGLIAYEMAAILQSQGEEVSAVLLFESVLQNRPPQTGAFNRAKALFCNLVFQGQMHWGSIALLPLSARWSYLKRRSGRAVAHISRNMIWRLRNLFMGEPKSSAVSLDQSLVLTTNAIDRAIKAYEPAAYPGRVLLFRSKTLPFGSDNDPTLGWSRIKIGHLKVVEVPVYPGALVLEPRAEVLARVLDPHLRSATSSAAP